MIKRFTLIMSTLLMLIGVGTSFAQVTNSAFNGKVTDNKNEALPGATVVITHKPTGTQYGAVTQANGRFYLPNIRPGGPYTLQVNFVGFKAQTKENVFVKLGQNLAVDFELKADVSTLEQVVVVSDQLFNNDRTGATSNINREKIEALPTISRSQQDYTRLTPQSDGNSFMGRNALFNNFSLDGSIFNNSFGLDAPTPGGQTSAQPVSLDAIDQLQVSIAPYDVRQSGFTGAGVNAITKSGTNEFKGSVYTFIRNEQMIGSKVAGTEVTNPDLKFNQYGFRLGGPIVRDKLFFFINGESVRREDPGSNFIASRPGVSGVNVSRVEASVMDQISSQLRNQYGYETGPYENYVYNTTNDKFLAKLDWNINKQNRLTLRYNYLKSVREQGPNPFAINFTGGRSPNVNTLPFRNSGYAINNNINSIVAELSTRLGNKMSNNLVIGYTQFRDFRTPFSAPFPTIEIAENNLSYTTVGHEPFSINNVLDQDVFQFTDNFTIYTGKNTWTFGANFEMFQFNNSFNLFYYGVFPVPAQFGGYSFSSVAEFLASTDPSSPSYRDYSAEVAQFQQTPYSLVEVDLGQLGVYGQLERQVNNKVKLTFGLRVDFPMYFSSIESNPLVTALTFKDNDNNDEQLDVGKLPNINPLFAPRFGFNVDLNGDQSTQLRGGTGIFSGRVPFVWIGNQASNRGSNDPANIGVVNATTEGFRFPQVWKTNLAVDQKLPWGMVGTLEFLYSKDVNAVTVRNANLTAPTRTLPDGRTGFDATSNKVNTQVGGAYVLDNTNKGYQLSITAQLKKRFKSGLDIGLAYSYLDSRDMLISTEISQFIFEGNPIQSNPNQPNLSFSQFGLKHRIIGSLSYRKEYAKNFATSVALFYESGQGARYSYTYSGDLNGDGVAANDLIYVPNSQSEINLVDIQDGNGNVVKTAAQQWAELNAFIEQDSYMSKNRGKILERNGALSPWFHNIDFRILQDFYVKVGGKRNTLQLSLDVLNLGNLLNSTWGVRQVFNIAQPINFVGNDANGNPQFQYTNTFTESFRSDVSLNSRWRAQIGIRYIFN
jgi:hypothetical protein